MKSALKSAVKFLFAPLLLLAGPAAAAPAAAAPASAAGSLIIAGGALSPDNADVHRAFLARRPANAPVIAIIPSASGRPADSAAAFAQTLIRHGARADDIRTIQLASEDDPTTPDIDESRWNANATNQAEIAKLADAGAIWFTGGDQLRTTRLLLRENGADTPMLAAIRARLAAGAVIGGTSAGAAIMSRAMITNGESMPALTQPVLRQGRDDMREEGGQLVIGEGLGFLPNGLVDQHFDARARLGRLARALFTLPPARRIGFGIDENTALLVDLSANRAQAMGAAGVTLLDARSAARRSGERFGADGIILSVLGAGDSIALDSLALSPARSRKPIKPRATAPLAQASEVAPLAQAYADTPLAQACEVAPLAQACEVAPLAQGNSGGMAVPTPPLADLLADELIARAGTPAIERLSFAGKTAVVFRFGKAATTSGANGRDSVGVWRTTISQIVFSIRPVDLAIQELTQ